jgi:hypothetical protein
MTGLYSCFIFSFSFSPLSLHYIRILYIPFAPYLLVYLPLSPPISSFLSVSKTPEWNSTSITGGLYLFVSVAPNISECAHPGFYTSSSMSTSIPTLVSLSLTISVPTYICLYLYLSLPISVSTFICPNLYLSQPTVYIRLPISVSTCLRLYLYSYMSLPIFISICCISVSF